MTTKPNATEAITALNEAAYNAIRAVKGAPTMYRQRVLALGRMTDDLVEDLADVLENTE